MKSRTKFIKSSDNLKGVNFTEKEKEILEYLSLGYTPTDLMDDRIFDPPFDSEEIFGVLQKLNSRRKTI